MGIYLVKPGVTEGDVKVNFTLTLISMNKLAGTTFLDNGKGHRAMSSILVFKSSADDSWGWSKFIKKDELINDWFVKDDWILVKAYVEIIE